LTSCASPDQPDGLLRPILLQLERTKQVQRFKIPWLLLQNQSIEPFGIAQATLLMQFARLLEVPCHGLAPSWAALSDQSPAVLTQVGFGGSRRHRQAIAEKRIAGEGEPPLLDSAAA
jgi:hypothetical protein